MARGANVKGDQLRRLRVQAGLSAEELAERVGTSKAAIYSYENGTRRPSPRRLAELGMEIGCNPLHLVQENSSPSSLQQHRVTEGLTLAQAAHAVGVSRSTYRRIEQEALLPTRGGGAVLENLAFVLHLDTVALFRMLDAHPASQQRHQHVTRLLAELTGRAIPKDAPTIFPQVSSDDPVLGELADLLRQPVLLTARLVNQEIERLRDTHRRLAILEVERRFEPAGRTAGGLPTRTDHKINTFRHTIENFDELSARRLVELLRESLTYRQWRILAQLARATLVPGGGGAVPIHRTHESDRTCWQALLMWRSPSGPLARRHPESDTFNITSPGLRYYNHHRNFYACLYPRIDAPPAPWIAPHATHTTQRRPGTKRATTPER